MCNQTLNDSATFLGSLHARSWRKTSCASLSEQVLIQTNSLYSRSRSACRALFLRRIDVRRETSGSASYLHTTLLFAQGAHEGRRPSHCSIVRPNHPDTIFEQLTRLCFLPLACHTSHPNLSPLGLWCGDLGLLTQLCIRIGGLQTVLTRKRGWFWSQCFAHSTFAHSIFPGKDQRSNTKRTLRMWCTRSQKLAEFFEALLSLYVFPD